MARRSSTLTNSARDNAQEVGADTFDSQGAGEVLNDPGSSVTPPAKPRRKRGPNKPKPGTFTVETKACMKQEEIINLLTAHAVTQLGADVAANMRLQVSFDGRLLPLGDLLTGAVIQFATAQADE